MYTRFMRALCGVSILLLLVVAMGGCAIIIDDDPPPPLPEFGSVTICSQSSGVYGDVFLDGVYEGEIEEPFTCITIDNLQLDQTYTLRIEPWPEEVAAEKDFSFSFDGQIVDVNE